MSHLTLFEIAKLAKGVERAQREELLLTGLLGWTFENSNALLRRLLARAKPLDTDGNEGGPPLPRDDEYEVAREPGVTSDEGESGRFDLRIEWADLLAVIESKVVRLDSPDGLTAEQLQKYHLSVRKEKRTSYAVVALTPDTIDELRGRLSSLNTGRRNTFLLTWADLHEELEATDAEDGDPVDRLLARELRQAIELVPDLKPFRGFDDDEIAALRHISKAAEAVERLFRTVRGHLTAKGLEYQSARGGTGYPSGPWDRFYDPSFRLPSGTGEASDIYYGPWIRPEAGCYSVYLETEPGSEGRRALAHLLQTEPEFAKGLQEKLSKRFSGKLPKLGFSKCSAARIVVDVPLASDLFRLRASELPSLTAGVVQFLREEVAARLALKGSETKG